MISNGLLLCVISVSHNRYDVISVSYCYQQIPLPANSKGRKMTIKATGHFSVFIGLSLSCADAVAKNFATTSV